MVEKEPEWRRGKLVHHACDLSRIKHPTETSKHQMIIHLWNIKNFIVMYFFKLNLSESQKTFCYWLIMQSRMHGHSQYSQGIIRNTQSFR